MRSKIADDLLLAKISGACNLVVDEFNDRFNPGTTIHGPGRICYFGFKITQLEDVSVFVDGADKLLALE